MLHLLSNLKGTSSLLIDEKIRIRRKSRGKEAGRKEKACTGWEVKGRKSARRISENSVYCGSSKSIYSYHHGSRKITFTIEGSEKSRSPREILEIVPHTIEIK